MLIIQNHLPGLDQAAPGNEEARGQAPSSLRLPSPITDLSRWLQPPLAGNLILPHQYPAPRVFMSSPQRPWGQAGACCPARPPRTWVSTTTPSSR